MANDKVHANSVAMLLILLGEDFPIVRVIVLEIIVDIKEIDARCDSFRALESAAPKAQCMNLCPARIYQRPEYVSVTT